MAQVYVTKDLNKEYYTIYVVDWSKYFSTLDFVCNNEELYVQTRPPRIKIKPIRYKTHGPAHFSWTSILTTHDSHFVDEQTA